MKSSTSFNSPVNSFSPNPELNILATRYHSEHKSIAQILTKPEQINPDPEIDALEKDITKLFEASVRSYQEEHCLTGELNLVLMKGIEKLEEKHPKFQKMLLLIGGIIHFITRLFCEEYRSIFEQFSEHEFSLQQLEQIKEENSRLQKKIIQFSQKSKYLSNVKSMYLSKLHENRDQISFKQFEKLNQENRKLKLIINNQRKLIHQQQEREFCLDKLITAMKTKGIKVEDLLTDKSFTDVLRKNGNLIQPCPPDIFPQDTMDTPEKSSHEHS